MKNVNIKKVVAGAAALAIAAGSLGAVVSAANVADSSYTTPNGLARADMFNAQGAPSYNIVVGSTGHASDVVWAANIAAAIGKKAYNVSTASATGGDVVVEVGSEFTSTSIADGRKYDNITLASAYPNAVGQTLTHTNYSKLVRMDVDVDIDGDVTTLSNVSDKIMLSHIEDVYFETDEDVRALLMQISTGKVSYVLDLKGGIEYVSGGEATIAVGGDHDISIPFMGKMYKIRSISAAGDKIELVSEENTLIQMIGSEFSVEDGYTIKVGTVTQGDPNRVVLELYKDGAIVSTKVVRDGRSTNFDGKINEITVVSVNYASDQQSFIEVSTASEVFTLENETVVDDFTDADGREWKAKIDNTGSVNTKIVSITLTNEDGWYDILDSDDYSALRVGDSAQLPGDLGAISFLGLSTEDMYYFETGSGRLKWMSYRDNEHDIPMYVDTSMSGAQKITLDGVDYYVHYNDGALFVSDSSDSDVDPINGLLGTWDEDPGVWVWAGAEAPLEALEIIDLDADSLSGFAIQSDVDNDVYHYYAIVPHSPSRFGIALVEGYTADIAEDTKATWTFNGTDEDDALTHYPYFAGAVAKDTHYATFVIKDTAAAAETITLYIDPNTNVKKLVNTDKYDDLADKVVVSTGITLDDYDSSELREAITLRGSEIKIASGNFIMNQPKEVRKVEYAIGGGVSSSTTMLGSEVTLTTPGEVVDADGIKVKLVSAPQGSATTYTPAAFGNIAYLDTDTLPAGNKIIVGGWMVNEEAKNLGLQDLVTKAGDFVAGKNAQGNIVVAGFHKEDTANAAKELISAIEAMN